MFSISKYFQNMSLFKAKSAQKWAFKARCCRWKEESMRTELLVWHLHVSKTRHFIHLCKNGQNTNNYTTYYYIILQQSIPVLLWWDFADLISSLNEIIIYMYYMFENHGTQTWKEFYAIVHILGKKNKKNSITSRFSLIKTQEGRN